MVKPDDCRSCADCDYRGVYLGTSHKGVLCNASGSYEVRGAKTSGCDDYKNSCDSDVHKEE